MGVFQFPYIFNRHRLLICISTVVILFLIDAILKLSQQNQSEYCDAQRIQAHYMNNLSAYHLMQSKPVRSNPFEYEFDNRDFCGKAEFDIDLLIFVVSNSSSYERRNAIRRTFGNLDYVQKYTHEAFSKLEVRLLFLISIDEYRLKSILFEEKIHNDIVQVQIPEGDLMNTYRDLAVFDWSSTYCPQARFLFKMDDVVFLNPFLLLKFINENGNDRINRESPQPFNSERFCSQLDARLPLLFGFVHSHGNARRESLPFTPDGYPCDVHPNYLNANVYLISNDARDLILCTFYRQSTAPFVLSNIYLTGILPEYLHIERQSLTDYKMNFDSTRSCSTFFTRTNPRQAFACMTPADLTSPIVEHYRHYWQSLVEILEI